MPFREALPEARALRVGDAAPLTSRYVPFAGSLSGCSTDAASRLRSLPAGEIIRSGRGVALSDLHRVGTEDHFGGV